MIEILKRIYIKSDDSKDVKRQKYGFICGLAGIILNIILFLSKLIFGIVTSYISLIADSLNNLSDAASSIVVLFGFKISSKKADKQHPYGHRKSRVY